LIRHWGLTGQTSESTQADSEGSGSEVYGLIRTYTTKAGDTWDIVAYREYGDEFRMTELQQANPDHLGVLMFDAGVVLQIPDVEIPTASVLPPWKQ
jgi:phage tail protein X